ncbi:unnamed protein product [Adineta steineri]|uniref:Uncharacterized protein n=1 Tax=Adineta steineri TaxID=433720 RepID=A0A814E0B8_9BILA|nr:unnamed protein product [Adineta steineri]CAF0916322.1 unnamed protein product [Adineta steineri]CAF0960685.1 unnamed protein product [Adineta steineri]
MSSLQFYNSIILAIHCLIPFSLNIISALPIIINTVRQRAIVRKEQLYMHQLRKQCYEFKYLFISPVIVVA